MATPAVEGSPWNVSSSVAIEAFSIVRATGIGEGGCLTVTGAKADLSAHTTPILGVVQSALDGSGTDRASWLNRGATILRGEVGLVLAHSSEILYLSATDPGAVTNVAPSLAVPVALSLDTDAYDGADNLFFTAEFQPGGVTPAGPGGPATAIKESGGPTTLPIGVISDRDLLQRAGGGVQGINVALVAQKLAGIDIAGGTTSATSLTTIATVTPPSNFQVSGFRNGFRLRVHLDISGGADSGISVVIKWGTRTIWTLTQIGAAPIDGSNWGLVVETVGVFGTSFSTQVHTSSVATFWNDAGSPVPIFPATRSTTFSQTTPTADFTVQASTTDGTALVAMDLLELESL